MNPYNHPGRIPQPLPQRRVVQIKPPMPNHFAFHQPQPGYPYAAIHRPLPHSAPMSLPPPPHRLPGRPLPMTHHQSYPHYNTLPNHNPLPFVPHPSIPPQPSAYPHHQSNHPSNAQHFAHSNSHPSTPSNNSMPSNGKQRWQWSDDKSNRRKNSSNSSNHRRNDEQEIHRDFVIDKQGTARGGLQPVPHYKVSNDIPFPLGGLLSGKKSSLTVESEPSSLELMQGYAHCIPSDFLSFSNCFNCGGQHLIRQCKYSRDQRCIRFNRHLHEKYVANSGSSKNKKRRGPNQRYFDIASSQSNGRNRPKSGSKSREHHKTTDSMPDLDEYLEALSKQKSTSSQSDCASSPKVLKRQSSSEPEEGQIHEDNEPDGTDQNVNESGPKLGFKFGDQIEGLKIYRTIEEIETSLKEHKEEMEMDQKEMDSNKNRNKYMRSGETMKQNQNMNLNRSRNGGGYRDGDGNGNRDRDNRESDYNRSDNRKRKRDQNDHRGSDGNDYRSSSNGRSRKRQRREDSPEPTHRYQLRSRSKSRGRDRSPSRGRGDRSDRSRGRSSRGRRDRSQSREGWTQRKGSRSGSRGRYRNGDGHSDEEIDYGFSKKKKKINQYIDDRYKKNGKGRQQNRTKYNVKSR